MRHAASVILITALSLNAARAAEAPSPSEPLGRWVTASGNLEVEVAHCGPALCGTATKVLANRSMSPGSDDTMKPVDTRPVLGMKILIDFVPDEDEPGQWQGRIYNRENGKTYRCKMSMDAQGGLVLHAYVGLPLFGKAQTWHRGQP